MVVYSYMALSVSGNQQFIPFLYNVYTPHGHWSALIVILSDTVIKVSAVWYHWSCIMLFETYCASIWKPCHRACPWWNTCCHDGRGSFWSSRSKNSVRVHFNVHTFTQLCVPVDFCTVYHFLACLSFVFAFPPLLVPTFCNQLPKLTDLWMFYEVMCTVTQAEVQSAHSFFNMAKKNKKKQKINKFPSLLPKSLTGLQIVSIILAECAICHIRLWANEYYCIKNIVDLSPLKARLNFRTPTVEDSKNVSFITTLRSQHR